VYIPNKFGNFDSDSESLVRESASLMAMVTMDKAILSKARMMTLIKSGGMIMLLWMKTSNNNIVTKISLRNLKSPPPNKTKSYLVQFNRRIPLLILRWKFVKMNLLSFCPKVLVYETQQEVMTT
jgi:hypothetical protein